MKLMFAISIIIFWLCFPFGVIIMSSQLETTELDVTYYNTITEPTGFNAFSTIWNLVRIYFRAMYMFIPGVTGIWTLLVVILQIVSGLILYLLLRGD